MQIMNADVVTNIYSVKNIWFTDVIMIWEPLLVFKVEKNIFIDD